MTSSSIHSSISVCFRFRVYHHLIFWLQRSVTRMIFSMMSTITESTIRTHGRVLRSFVSRKSPFLRPEDFLATGEFEFRPSQGFNHRSVHAVLRSDTHNRLTDGHTRSCTKRFSIRTTHTRLQSIRTSTRKHFVNTQDLERMTTNAEMEIIFAAEFRQVSIRGNTRGFQSFGTQLLFFIRHQVHDQRKHIYRGFLRTDVIDADFRIRYTTAVSGLDKGFFILKAVTFCWSTSHDDMTQRETEEEWKWK